MASLLKSELRVPYIMHNFPWWTLTVKVNIWMFYTPLTLRTPYCRKFDYINIVNNLLCIYVSLYTKYTKPCTFKIPKSNTTVGLGRGGEAKTMVQTVGDARPTDIFRNLIPVNRLKEGRQDEYRTWNCHYCYSM